jgi:uncharacterized membrane protein
MTIRNPVEWGVEQIRSTVTAVASTSRDAHRTEHGALPVVRRLDVSDLKDALAKGFNDFGANRTDVIFLCAFYPIVGLVLGRLVSGAEMLPLLFPLASGFALVGPLAAVGLYEISRRRELGGNVSWADAFAVLRSHSFGAIVLLGMLLVAILAIWLLVAEGIFLITLGPASPTSVGSFIHDVFRTRAGWTLIIAGVGVGFLFALLVLAIGAFSFPLLLDREVSVQTAVRASVRAVAANPVTMAVWGVIVAGSLVIGSVPLFLGLVVVLPVLGHSTWHLYRKVMPR